MAAPSSVAAFAKKFAIGGALTVAAIMFLTSYVASTVATTFEVTVSRIIQRQMAAANAPRLRRRLEAQLERAGDPQRALAADKQQKLIAEIRAAARTWGPFIAEAVAAINEELQTAQAARATTRTIVKE